jgi:hypothetical protein
VVAVVPAAEGVSGRDFVPGDGLGNGAQRLRECPDNLLNLGSSPGDEVEPRAAPERGAVDDPVEAVAQQGGKQVLDGVQASGGEGVLVGLDQPEVEVGDCVPPGASSRAIRRT